MKLQKIQCLAAVTFYPVRCLHFFLAALSLNTKEVAQTAHILVSALAEVLAYGMKFR